jgi:lipopolysaccharide export system protein LptA
VACALLLGASARAEEKAASGDGGFGDLSFTSSDEPIVIEADKLEFDYESNRLVYRGKVNVVQGEFELSSNTLIVTFDRADELEKAQLREVVAEGDVVITQGERRASGEVAVFDQATRQIVLRGNPVLRDGKNEVQGDRLTVYLDEGRSVIESSPKKRVSAVLYPGQPEKAGAGTPSPSPGDAP